MLVRMAIPLNLLPWRNFLGGFLHGIQNHSDWNLQILNTSDSETEVSDDLADGLIVGNISEKTAARSKQDRCHTRLLRRKKRVHRM